MLKRRRRVGKRVSAIATRGSIVQLDGFVGDRTLKWRVVVAPSADPGYTPGVTVKGRIGTLSPRFEASSDSLYTDYSLGGVSQQWGYGPVSTDWFTFHGPFTLDVMTTTHVADGETPFFCWIEYYGHDLGACIGQTPDEILSETGGTAVSFSLGGNGRLMLRRYDAWGDRALAVTANVSAGIGKLFVDPATDLSWIDDGNVASLYDNYIVDIRASDNPVFRDILDISAPCSVWIYAGSSGVSGSIRMAEIVYPTSPIGVGQHGRAR